MTTNGSTNHNIYNPDVAPELEICSKCSKAIHESKGKAKSQVKKSERTKKTSGPLEVYKCPYGNGWHIRHKKSQAVRTGRKAE